jgi:hypothetical protein
VIGGPVMAPGRTRAVTGCGDSRASRIHTHRCGPR